MAVVARLERVNVYLYSIQKLIKNDTVCFNFI